MRRLSLLLISAVMALTLIAVAAGVAGAQQPDPQNAYGVLMYSDNTLFWRTDSTLGNARLEATSACEAANDGPCVFAVWVRNGWAAYTEGDNLDGTIAAFVSWERTQKAASDEGIQACKDAGARSCHSNSFATSFDPSQPTTGGFTPQESRQQSILTSPR